MTINVKQYGAKGDGVTDDLPAFRAALTAAAGNRGIVEVPMRGRYLVSGPVQVGPATTLRGEGGPGTNDCSMIVAKDVPWPAHRGVIESSNYTDYSGTAPFAHGTWFEALQVDCQNRKSLVRPEYGVVLWAGGEQSGMRRMSSHNFRTASIFCPGTHAVLQIEDSSAWQSDGHGVKFSSHPNPAMPRTGTQARGDANSGTVRLLGISGDANKKGLLYADGAGKYFAVIKSEYNDPVVVSAGGKRGGPRQRWEIAGYSSQQQGMTTPKVFVRVTDGGRPQIVVGAGASYFTEWALYCDDKPGAVDDPIVANRGLSIRDVGDGQAFHWDPEYPYFIVASNGRWP